MAVDLTLGMKFQHAAARRRLAICCDSSEYFSCFNTQPPEGGWFFRIYAKTSFLLFQHAAARRRLAWLYNLTFSKNYVSTRSRPKAAGCFLSRRCSLKQSFNTQPPEGGWCLRFGLVCGFGLFQHAAARRRLEPLSKALLHQVSQP